MANIWQTNVSLAGEEAVISRLMEKVHDEQTWVNACIDNAIDAEECPGVEFHGNHVAIFTRGAPNLLLELLERLSAEIADVSMKIGFFDLSCFVDCPYVPLFTGNLQAGILSDRIEEKIFNISAIAMTPQDLIDKDPALIEYLRHNEAKVKAERTRIESSLCLR